jgi:PucR family transcriptional regulator, purine catabolism regulatory protein
MPPTLASLVHHSALKLTVRAGEDRLDVPVRWAHVSELADPVPYMEGGELLLITALKLDAEDPQAMRRYVKRLVGAGVVGLGFAIGVNYDEIPEALVGAAEREGLPLLEVPRRTPFLAISKAVSAAIAADQYRAVTAGFAAQRELTRQALNAGPEGLLAALAAQVDGWAALYDASGAVVATAPEWAGRRAARLTAEVDRRRPPRWWAARTTRTGWNCTRWAPAAGPGRPSRSAPPPPSAPPSGTPCTRPSPCSR